MKFLDEKLNVNLKNEKEKLGFGINFEKNFTFIPI